MLPVCIQVGRALRSLDIDKFTLGFNQAEIWLKFEPAGAEKEDAVFIIMPAKTVKRMLQDLQPAFENWRRANVKAAKLLEDKPSKYTESAPRRVIKALYKSRRLTKNLLAVNTKRRRHIESE